MDASNLQPGSAFGRYAINRRIGSGGMGSVYEATHLDLKKRVALKVLHEEAAENKEVQARFLREGEAASRIQHDHVVNVTDFGVQDGVPYLVMEFLEGEGLSALLAREGPLSVARSVDILLPVLAAVGAAHEVGVIHRDLKPDNIFLVKTRKGEPEPKVVDFGISKVSDLMVSLTGADAVFGSPHYMPPEQMTATKGVTAASDQYALGVMLYECVTGHIPFDAGQIGELMRLVMLGEVTPPSAHRPDLPPAIERAILRAMAKTPEGRYGSVYGLGRALLPFAGERAQLVWHDQFVAASPDEGGETRVEPPAPPASQAPPPPAAPAAKPDPLAATVAVSRGSRKTLEPEMVAAARAAASSVPPPPLADAAAPPASVDAEVAPAATRDVDAPRAPAGRPAGLWIGIALAVVAAILVAWRLIA